MTLVELLLAAMMTAFIAAAAATLLNGAANASNQSRNTRDITTAGHFAEGRIGAVIRQARAIGQVTATKISVWVADTNDDDILQLSEAGVIFYDSATKGIYIQQTAASATSASSTVVAGSSFKDADQLSKEISAVPNKSSQWADDVQVCAFDGYPSLTDTRVVSVTFTIGSGGDATDFAVTAGPKASADYLFQSSTRSAPSGSETRYTRSKVSPYSGVSTAQ